MSRACMRHELGHVAFGDTSAPREGLFQYRRDLRTDDFAARPLRPDLELLARTTMDTCTDGHATRKLGVALDLYRTRLDTVTPDERAIIDAHVVDHSGEWGA